MIVFLKSVIPGGTGDLFPATVPVRGYAARSGAYIGPHTATRLKRAPSDGLPGHASRTVQVHGVPVTFPDRAHHALYAAGAALHAGAPLSEADKHRLWGHFAGYVEHDPDGDRPFGHPDHVPDLAREYAGEVLDDLPQGRPVHAGSVVDPDRLGDYCRRDLDTLPGSLNKAMILLFGPRP